MDYRAQYRQLVRELERLGGDLRGVPRYYSLEAEAKVRRLIKERQGGGGEPPRAKDKGEWQFAPTGVIHYVLLCGRVGRTPRPLSGY